MADEATPNVRPQDLKFAVRLGPSASQEPFRADVSPASSLFL